MHKDSQDYISQKIMDNKFVLKIIWLRSLQITDSFLFLQIKLFIIKKTCGYFYAKQNLFIKLTKYFS